MTLFFLSMVLICVFMSGYFSGSESGLYFLKRESLVIRSAKGSQAAGELLKILKKPGAVIGAMLIGNTIVLEGGTYALTLFFKHIEWEPEWISREIAVTLILFPPYFAFGEVLPKATFRLYSEPLMLGLYPVMKFFRYLLSPLTVLVAGLARLLEKFFATGEEVEEVYDEKLLSQTFGHAFRDGVLSEEQMESLARLVQVGNVQVEKVMIPLLQGALVSVDAGHEELAKLYQVTSRNVYPVYDTNKTNVVGTVDVRKVVFDNVQDAQPVRQLLSPPSFIEKGEDFVNVFQVFEQDRDLVFVRSGEKVVGYLCREEALFRLLR